jgi:hypothetical protein
MYCNDNMLTSLDVRSFPLIETLDCRRNNLSSLLASNPALRFIYCGENQLTELDISLNTDLSMLSCTDMPTLEKVCVWTLPLPEEQVSVDSTGSPNIYLTTDCSR